MFFSRKNENCLSSCSIFSDPKSKFTFSRKILINRLKTIIENSNHLPHIVIPKKETISFYPLACFLTIASVKDLTAQIYFLTFHSRDFTPTKNIVETYEINRFSRDPNPTLMPPTFASFRSNLG